MKVFRALLSVAIVLNLLACTAQSAREKPGPALQVSGKTRVAIPNAAFGKEYLLSTSYIQQSGAPTGWGLDGKVVFFEKFDDEVDMYESTRGQVVTEDLPARRLLATFPVLSEEGNAVVIDFNQGMRRVSMADWWAGPDRFDPNFRERSAELPQARIFEAKVEDSVLSIRQAAQARSRASDPDLELRMEIRYFISPYNPGEFEPKEMHPEESRFARFFVAPHQLELESGRSSAKMALFDISEPVDFYYSANTPEDMEEAVKAGILYWNKAFGKEIVRARKAPEGMTAPDPQRNMVQWVPWDDAGFAYADLLLDPLTGEAMRGQAYMTSVFSLGGKARARALLRSMRAIAESSRPEDSDSDTGSHFGAGHAGCRMDHRAFAIQMSDGLEEMLANPELTEEAVLRVAQAYVCEVTAHEVGHVLGLRHNFAGSLGATLSPEQLDQFFADFVAGDDLAKYEKEVAATSVMEYIDLKAAVFVGWKIQNSDDPLSHDKAAIQWGYFDDKTVVEEKQFFGSDEEANQYGDILRFDYGKDPVLAQYSELSALIRNLPNGVIERFIAARAPLDPRDRRSLESVNLSASVYADRIAEPARNVLRWFRKETRSWRVERDFDYIGDLNEEDRLEAHWKYLNEQLEAIGGVDRVVFAHLPADIGIKVDKKIETVEIAPKIDAKELAKRLKELLDSEAYESFVGLDDETYTWTDEEKKVIVERGTQLFEKLEEAVLLRTLQLFEDAPRDLGLAATGRLSEDDQVAKLESRIIELAKSVIVKRNKDDRIAGKVDKAFVEVPDFEYSYETRLAAAKALNDKTGSFELWSKEAKARLHEELKGAVEESLNIGLFKDFDDSMLSRPLREWYLGEQNLLKLLPPAPKNGNGRG